MERKSYITACWHYLLTYDYTTKEVAHRAITEQERRNECTEAVQIAHFERNEIPHLLSIYKEVIWTGFCYTLTRYITLIDGTCRYVYRRFGEGKDTQIQEIVDDYVEYIRSKYINEQNPL